MALRQPLFTGQFCGRSSLKTQHQVLRTIASRGYLSRATVNHRIMFFLTLLVSSLLNTVGVHADRRQGDFRDTLSVLTRAQEASQSLKDMRVLQSGETFEQECAGDTVHS